MLGEVILLGDDISTLQ